VKAATDTPTPARRIEPARALLALLAIALIVWFGLLARNQAVGTAASKRVVANPGMSAAEWDRAMDDLRSADLLDPGTDWDLVRAQYLLLRDRRAALQVADDVLAEEPDNLDAWWVVLRGARSIDPERRREAAAQVQRLNPRLPGG
jgi:hypothetical protein